MSTRVQVILSDEERARFRAEARRAGMSLSAWLRMAGHERLEASRRRTAIASVEDLRAFFEACDAREEGTEPDWAAHERALESSVRSGLSDP